MTPPPVFLRKVFMKLDLGVDFVCKVLILLDRDANRGCGFLGHADGR